MSDSASSGPPGDNPSHNASQVWQQMILASRIVVIMEQNETLGNMCTIKSKIGGKFEQKRKAKWVKEKANLVKAYGPSSLPLSTPLTPIQVGDFTTHFPLSPHTPGPLLISHLFY